MQRGVGNGGGAPRPERSRRIAPGAAGKGRRRLAPLGGGAVALAVLVSLQAAGAGPAARPPTSMPNASEPAHTVHDHLTSVRRTGRAMWLWDWSDSAAVVAFAKAHGIEEIFAYTAPGFLDPAMVPPQWTHPELPVLTSLVSDATAAGVRVMALGGDPSWVRNPSVAITWARNVARSGLFTGAHLDLEPWQLPDWSTEHVALSGALVAVTGEVRAALGRTPLEISVPWWLDRYETPSGTPLDVALLHETDSVAIATFFSTSRAVLDNVRGVAAAARAAGVPFRIGVQTNPSPYAWTTYAGSSASQLSTSLAAIDAANASDPDYLGVAVESYHGWRDVTA